MDNDNLTRSELRLQKRSEYNKSSNTNRSYRSSRFSSFGNFLSIFIGVILLSVLIKFLTGSDDFPTFSSFLSFLETSPSFQIPFLDVTETVLGDWGFLNFIRDLIQTITSIFDVLIFLLNGLINIMHYVVYFVQWLF